MSNVKSDLEKVFTAKRDSRKKLAAKPVAEKLRIVEELAERILATRKDTAAKLPDEPWEVPSNWSWKRMGEVSKVVGGGTPRTDRPEYFGGEVPWITPADLSRHHGKMIACGARSITADGLSNSGAQLVPAGTVLFSSRAPIGYVAIAASEVATNQGFKSFVLRPELIPAYVFYYLQRARHLALALASGTTFLEVSGKNAAMIPIPVPPLAEQQRIVAEIEKQFTRLEAASNSLLSAKANLRGYRNAILDAAFFGEVGGEEPDVLRRRKYRSTADARSELPPIPEGWTWMTLGELSTDSRYGTSEKCAYENAGAPVLRIPNISKGQVDYTDLKFASGQSTAGGDRAIDVGDLLVVRTNGSRNLIGRGAVVRRRPDRLTTFASYLIRFRLAGHSSMFRWISTIWNAPFLRAWLEEHAATSAGQYNLSMTTLSKLPIPVPSPSEQDRIAGETEKLLSVADEADAVVNATLARTKNLRQSILNRAFSGQL